MLYSLHVQQRVINKNKLAHLLLKERNKLTCT